MTYHWHTPISGQVWIYSSSGEAGMFDAEEFNLVLTAARLTGDVQEMVGRFFWENF